jgi:hypothetical protein
MTIKTANGVGSVQKTLLLPRWGRAVETDKSTPLLVDATSARMIGPPPGRARSGVHPFALAGGRTPRACKPGPLFAGGPSGFIPTETTGSPRFLSEPLPARRALRPRWDLRARPLSALRHRHTR